MLDRRSKRKIINGRVKLNVAAEEFKDVRTDRIAVVVNLVRVGTRCWPVRFRQMRTRMVEMNSI